MLVDPSQIERIEVVKGSASVLYGSDAIGGVVNVITKKGGKRPAQVDVNTYYNSSSNQFGRSVSAYGLVDNFEYRISTSKTTQDELRTGGGDTIKNSDQQQHNVNAYLGYHFDNAEIGLSVERFVIDYNDLTPHSFQYKAFLPQ